MSVKLLFLDLDGVLNDHVIDPIAESSTLLPRCVAQLNRIIDATDCRIVLVSAWRYMVLNAAMTLQGFEYLLRTHGVHARGRLIGRIRPDWEPLATPSVERGRQVREWLDAHRHGGIDRYVAIDDLDLGYGEFGIPLVDTDGKVGLTEAEADRAIAILCLPGDDDTAEFPVPGPFTWLCPACGWDEPTEYASTDGEGRPICPQCFAATGAWTPLTRKPPKGDKS